MEEEVKEEAPLFRKSICIIYLDFLALEHYYHFFKKNQFYFFEEFF
jgi:hypothetical protein